MTEYFALASLAGGLLVASLHDVAWRRIPNWLNLSLALAGLAFALHTRGGGGAGDSLLGCCLGLALLALPYGKGWIGAGDVKLLGAVGAWLGPLGTVYCGLASAIAGGVLAIACLFFGGRAHRRAVLINLRLAVYLRALPEIERRPARIQPPYGVAISVGTAVAIIIGQGGIGG
jgi:prepilin peptidase CpaA